MQNYHEFDCEDRHYTVDVEFKDDDVKFVVLDDKQNKILKIKANTLNLNDQISAMKSRIQTSDVNLKKIIESFAVGFITLPKNI